MLMLVVSKSYQIYHNGAVNSQLTVLGGTLCVGLGLGSESVEGVPVERRLQYSEINPIV
jgi:hypothetical protein